MQTLRPTLFDYDPGLLAIIAHRWDVDLEAQDKREAVEQLADAMLDPARAAVEWSRLTDAERGALHTLLAAPDHTMPEGQFTRLFGPIRPMGPAKREREKPHLDPASVAETLFYRGLLARGVAELRSGPQAVLFVPPDLADVLPSRETRFEAPDKAEPETWPQESTAAPEHITPATTALVDDLTTLLAYLQTHRVSDELPPKALEPVRPQWISTAPPRFAVALAASMEIVAGDSGLLKPVPAAARRWLEATRPRQVRALAEAWRTSTVYNDLWHTPGLRPEDTGWRNDPLLARQAILTFLEMAPPADWWPVEDLIELVKAEEPDFQRPGSDYDSWYIRDAKTGAYLRGFESWDRVDGAVLRFILTGPLHWLGLADLGDGGRFCRLTIYGRALIGEADWPDPPEERTPLTIAADGTLQAPRTLSRYERFQLSRIAEWVSSGASYTYRLTAASLQAAAAHGIEGEAVLAFLRRAAGGQVPESVQEMLTQWKQTGSATAWLTRAIVLRTETAEALQTVLDTPELRRYLGAPLGPTAVLVRVGQEEALAAALQQHGILVEFDA